MPYIVQQAPPAAPITITAATAATQVFAVLAGEPGAGTQCNLNSLGSNKLNGQTYTVRASGLITTSGTQTLATTAATPIQFLLCAANTASFAAVAANAIVSGTALAAFTQAAATGTFSAPFELEFQATGSSVLSGVGQGYVTDLNGKTTATARAASTNAFTGVNMQSEPPVQFAVAVVNAASTLLTGTITVTLNQLVLES
jgi:hypothetical protein